MKILVIEDQEMNWDLYQRILARKCRIPKENITRARWYTEAEEKISFGCYDVVFLDHRMPHDDPGCTDTDDFDKFVETLRNIGYGLIPLLLKKQPHAAIIGTSSLDRYDIGQYAIPDRRLNKTDMFHELPAIIRSLS
ncbi:MAG: hypothetical protein Q8R30_03670 [bacterium]|nr:hypothetical protein [bacterium]